MISVTNTDTGIEICLSRRGDGFSSADLKRVADGVNDEDMRTVRADTLVGSYATFGAYIDSETGERKLVGFARQVQRDFMVTSSDEKLCIGELGTVWVDPAYRNQQIGMALIRSATQFMNIIGFIPVAVCNELSRNSFEKVGYTPVATLPNENGHERIVEMYENHQDWLVRQNWTCGLRDEVFDFMQSLPRFERIVWRPNTDTGLVPSDTM